MATFSSTWALRSPVFSRLILAQKALEGEEELHHDLLGLLFAPIFGVAFSKNMLSVSHNGFWTPPVGWLLKGEKNTRDTVVS